MRLAEIPTSHPQYSREEMRFGDPQTTSRAAFLTTVSKNFSSVHASHALGIAENILPLTFRTASGNFSLIIQYFTMDN